MSRLVSILILLSIALFFVLGTAESTTQAAESGGPKLDGKALFTTHACNMCHSAAAAGIEAKTKAEKLKGPDLSGYETKHSFVEIAAFAKGEQERDGKKHKKPFKGSDEELQAIIDWLGSLEAQK